MKTIDGIGMKEKLEKKIILMLIPQLKREDTKEVVEDMSMLPSHPH